MDGVVDRLLLLIDTQGTDKVDDANDALGRFEEMGAAAVAAAAALSVSLVDMAEDAAYSAVASQQLADTVGTTAQTIQELGFAAGRFGGDMDDVADALITLADRAEDAKGGMQSSIDDFALVGIAVDDLRDKDPVGLFEAFAEGVAQTEDAGKRSAAIARILGDDLGRRLAPLLLRGRDGLRAFREEARELGVVAGPEAVKQSRRLIVAQSRLGNVLRGIQRRIGLGLVPELAEWAEGAIRVWERNRDFVLLRVDLTIDAITYALERLRGPLGVVVAMFGALVAMQIGSSLLAWAQATGGLAGALAGVAVAAVPLLKVAAAIAAIGLAIEDVVIFARGGKSVLGRILGSLGVAEEVRGVLVLIGDVFARLPRNIAKIGRAVTTYLEPAIRVISTLGEGLSRVGAVVLGQAADAAGDGVSTALPGTTGAMQRAARGFRRYAAATPAERAAATSSIYNGGNVSVEVDARGMTPEQAEQVVRRGVEGALQDAYQSTAGGTR